ncbi:MAG: hypothetical protein RBR15_13725 [Sphaerochaeta sp.]|nr:hypothetical protein [Sphaerochaeta sp.]
MKEKTISVYAHWEGMGEPQLIGTLFAQPGRQYPNPSRNTFGLFLDSSPDRWGRTLMQRRQSIVAKATGKKQRPLTESDYLLGVHDIARMVALRFKLEQDGPFIAEDSHLLRLLGHDCVSWNMEFPT